MCESDEGVKGRGKPNISDASKRDGGPADHYRPAAEVVKEDPSPSLWKIRRKYCQRETLHLYEQHADTDHFTA